MTNDVTNLPASVHQRLLNIARRDRVELEYVLLRYANERLLYRLSQSNTREQFILKGAMVLLVWGREVARQSRDIDLLGRQQIATEHVRDIFRVLCDLDVLPDGLRFDRESVDVQEIREQAEYGGVRVHVAAYLGKARVRLQIDIGFGDAVSPPPLEADLPVLLDFPAPHLLAYPKETVVAEKLEAIVRLGVANTRLKDFYDLWALARSYAFDGPALATAIEATFRRRQTELPSDVPAGLRPEFAERAETQWRAFCRRIDQHDVPPLVEATEAIRDFVMPICAGISSGRLPVTWIPPTGWN